MLEHHPLVKEFPELREQLHNMKENHHISNQMKKYEDLDKKIYNLESSGMFEDMQLEELKKQRLEIKDIIYKALKS
ncbi:YdcH family protein [Francisella noatunensis]|uniref:YdcH family protein n=3 Tax=Francisella TaxID=262 RepID=A0AAW3D9V9_9GAMM|nr:MULTISPECIES: YdcH family protein [Francisella]AJI46393.1 hypothetical protein BF30_1480 [Francisella philomiragia]AJI49767.1 hypothetical protein KU46_79 [Francisella philomiragia]AJI55957.1 hypothetical protein LA56_957 [Francisella philomiragia]AJI57784.1 hypothetical protein LA02_851 [Francisella philomiragia]AJI74900.1 hypothetical protein BZ13_771 [Francisella philomiragia subsp. philomiragia ATCC 25015]